MAKTGSVDQQALPPRYDYSEWPVFVVTMPRAPLSGPDFQSHVAACSEPYKRGQPFCWVVDLRYAPPLPAAYRKAIAETMRANVAKYPDLVRGSAIVVKSPLERGIVTAISWLSRSPYPHKAFDNLLEAKAWALRCLSKVIDLDA